VSAEAEERKRHVAEQNARLREQLRGRTVQVKEPKPEDPPPEDSADKDEPDDTADVFVLV
jgi:hypothetical protein